MCRLLGSLFIFLTSSVSLFANPNETPYRYSIESDFMWLQRDLCDSNKITQYYIVDGYFQNKQTTKNIASGFDHEPALKIAVEIYPQRKESIEGRFIGMLYYSITKTFTGFHDYTFPFVNSLATFDWINADKVKATYQSSYNNFDLNYIYHFISPGSDYFAVALGGGLRYAMMKDKFKLWYTKSANTSLYRIEAFNDILTAQLDLKLMAQPVKWFNWGVNLRFGPCADIIVVNNYLDDVNAEGDLFVMRNESNSAVMPGFMAELEPFATLSFFKEILNLKFAWNYIGYSGIALAPEQISYANTGSARLKKTSNMAYRGFSGGLVFRF